MDADKNNTGDRDRAGLSSAEYRARLLTKLNCLIAVLEVAIAKIARSIELPGADEERLSKIRGNLENTLAICHRAKATLETNVAPRAESGAARQPAQRGKAKMSYRDYVELSSIQEYRKFKQLPPISSKDIRATDVDELLRKLADS